jgi:hypothetical protein
MPRNYSVFRCRTVFLQPLKIGDLSEWLKEHAWKVCIPQKGIEGSNPSVSAFGRRSLGEGDLQSKDLEGLNYTQALSNMRLWSIHPKYLDAKGLVALWRETLLAKHVLEGKTKGYKNHPQLNRFKKSKKPLDSINHYLAVIHQEALSRKYNFDRQKVNWSFRPTSLPVTTGQIQYETIHLLSKIKRRDPKKYEELKTLLTFDPHPLFNVIDGDIEEWEIIASRN